MNNMKNVIKKIGYFILNFFVGYIFAGSILSLINSEFHLPFSNFKIIYIILVIFIIFYLIWLKKKKNTYSIIVLIISTIIFICWFLIFIHCFNIFGQIHHDIYCDFYEKIN